MLKDNQNLSSFETNVISACGVLCNEGPIPLYSFTEIFSPENSHDIISSIESFALKGRIIYYDEVIYYGPRGKMSKKTPSNHELIQRMLSRLVEKTSISIYQDRLSVRPYFVMGYSLANYVVKTIPHVNYRLYADLVCNLVENIEIWTPSQIDADTTQKIPIVQALLLCLKKIPFSPLVPRIHSYISLFFSNSWRYDMAMKHLDIAGRKDISIYGEIQDYTAYAFAEYYSNYGQYACALKYYRMAVNMNGNKYAISKIALILALLGEDESCKNYIKTHAHYFQSIPEIHEINVLHLMTLALLENNLESAKKHVNCAELILIQLNHRETPVGGVLHYVWSQIWSVYGYKAKSLNAYKQYVLNSMLNYKCDEGGWDILSAGRIGCHLDKGSHTTAKLISIRELDSITDIYSSQLSFSVRAEVSKCYVKLYKALKLFPLASTYNDIYAVHSKLYKPSSSTLDFIRPLFNDDIPPSITLDTAWETALEQLHIDIYILEERQFSHGSKTVDDIRNIIDDLRLKYPGLWAHLKIAEARLEIKTDFWKGIKMFTSTIDMASEEDYFWVARESANWLAYYGAIFEAADLYKQAILSETFQNIPDFSKFDFLLEYVTLIEKAGFRSDAQKYWDQLTTLANEEQLEWLTFNRALVEFDHEQWETCRLFLLEFFALYKRTQLFDEIYSSALCYYCSVLTRFGEYEAGLQAINDCLSLWVDSHGYERFPIFCNKIHCLIGLGDYSEARKIIKEAEKLVRSSADRLALDDLLDFLQTQKQINNK